MNEFSKYTIPDTASIHDALVALNDLSTNIQTLLVVNAANQMVGAVTDGDIRRGLIRGILIQDSIKKIAFKNFKYISEGHKDVTVIKDYKDDNIELLPCLNENKEIVKLYNLKKLKSILPIDAVLMAGGKGERLRPLTEKIPKPLLKVGNKPIIDYNVDSLISYGIENIHITVNYLAEQLEAHYKEPRENIKVECIKEPYYLGTIGSIKFIESFSNEIILVMNSDLFTNIDYEDFFLHFEKNEADMSVAAIPYSVSVPYGIFELEERNILSVKEKPIYNYYANAGIYLIKKKLLNLIPENTFFNATDFMELLIAKNYKVIRFPLTGYWIDIGKHEDFKKAQDFVKHL